MAKADTIFHIIEILGVFVCAHHLWPKGITYGETEEWEKSPRKRSSHKSKSMNGSSGSRRESARRERTVDDRPSRGDAESRSYSRRDERYERRRDYDDMNRPSRQYERA